MLGVGTGLGVNRVRQLGGGFDADYQAVLDYATSQGYTLPSAGQQTLQNQLVVDLKAAGVWSKLDSLRVYATNGDANYALIDWIRLLTMTAVNSPTFTANQGYQGDGISAYINTGYNLAVDGINYQLNSASFFRYKRLNRTVGTSGTYDGARQSSPTSFVLLSAENNVNTDNYINSSSFGSFLNIPDTLGFQLNTRDSATTSAIYINGTLVNNMNVASVATPNANYYDFGYSNVGALTFPHNAQLSIAGAGGDLTSEQSDFNNAIQTYITSL